MGWIRTAGRKFAELGVDIIWIGDDFGTQNRMLLSPKIFREFFKPRYAALFAEWKSINPQVKIRFHTDGYVIPSSRISLRLGWTSSTPSSPTIIWPASRRNLKPSHSWEPSTSKKCSRPTPEEVAGEVKLVPSTGGGGGLIIAPAITSSFFLLLSLFFLPPFLFFSSSLDVPIQNVLNFYETAQNLRVSAPVGELKNVRSGAYERRH
ncbi:MAG: hypothetical protein U0V70_03290 [Terriglobia bacterium]